MYSQLHKNPSALNQFIPQGQHKSVVQPKLSINTPGDEFEQEADAMAEHVMRMPVNENHYKPKTGIIAASVQRKCTSCEEEEKKKKPIMRKTEGGYCGIQASDSMVSSLNATKGGGSPLPQGTRSFMENAFSSSFSGVRIHTNNAATGLSRSISARAFTYGQDIYFNQGEYNPTTTNGKYLLAHELTHTLQQGRGVSRMLLQRTPGREELVEFDRQVVTIRAHSAYRALPSATRRLINEIIAIARRRDNWQYYLTNLLLLLNTPDAPPVTPVPDTSSGSAPATTPRSTRQLNEEEVNDSLSTERSRLFYPEGSLAVNSEENQTTTPPRVWRLQRGEGGKYYRVDARDPGNIFVKLKVKLNGRNAQDIANVREMEDGIEKKAATFGYVVNLEFVNNSGNDVFNVGVNLTQWTTSGNWAGGVNALAHEMHHLLGLDDRYNYIDAHAANADMDMPDRVYWFRQQMNKSASARDADSIMNDHTTGTLQTDDIAGVAHISEATIVAGQQARRDFISSARRRAAHRVSIAYLRVNGTSPQFNRYAQLETVRGLIAPDIVNLEQIADILSRMHSILMGGTITVGPEIDACATWAAYVMGGRVPIHLCSRYFALSEEQQVRTLIHEAAHAVGIGQMEGETYFPFYDCTPSTDDNWSVADAWARYINCVSGQTPDTAEAVTGRVPASP